MTSIWAKRADGWTLLAPVGFPDEPALHEQVEKAPQLLPLSGSPRLVVLGSQVPLGGGYADILAIEPSGRLVLIEVKLAKNSEARRAVVAQILAYAASLRGVDPQVLEGQILRSHLAKRGVNSIAEVAEGEDPEGSFNADRFGSGLSDSLAAGRFRLVLVLDDAPAELVRLVGYLELIAPELSIDLVTVSAYDVEGTRVLVPQRIEPERATAESSPDVPQTAKAQGYWIDPDDFQQGIDEAQEADRPALRRLYEWARGLEQEGLIRLRAYRGTTGRTTLLPYLLNDDAGLVTIWNDNGLLLSVWRSVFERRAPTSIDRVEQLIAPVKIGQGNTLRDPSDALLDALADAYREAAV